MPSCGRRGLFLPVNFVGYSEFFASFCATRGEHTASIGRGHTLAKTVFVVSLAIVRLERSFHCCISILFCGFRHTGAPAVRGAKLKIIPCMAKHRRSFLSVFAQLEYSLPDLASVAIPPLWLGG